MRLSGLQLAGLLLFIFFFFNDTATTEIYTLSLHGRSSDLRGQLGPRRTRALRCARVVFLHALRRARSEEHTSELQSQSNIVCRLLLEKKKTERPGPRTARSRTGRPAFN